MAINPALRASGDQQKSAEAWPQCPPAGKSPPFINDCAGYKYQQYPSEPAHRRAQKRCELGFLRAQFCIAPRPRLAELAISKYSTERQLPEPVPWQVKGSQGVRGDSGDIQDKRNDSNGYHHAKLFFPQLPGGQKEQWPEEIELLFHAKGPQMDQ